MEISLIKSQLSIAMVLHYYGLKPDKNAKMCCPFHEDKTPSMQIYYKTQTAYCFSSNCKTHGKSMDVIDFIMHKEDLSKHEAIKKAEEILNPSSGNQKISREKFLENMFTYFRNAITNSKPAKEYLEKRGLDFTRIEIGYNSGQFHHGERKTDDFYKQKIVWGNLNLQAGFSFAPAGYFVNAPSPLIASESNFLLTFLNSKIADYYIRSLGITRNGGYFEYKPMFVELLPIPDYLKDESLEQKCRELLSKKTENFEDSINKIFYELYQLSTEEIEFIESR